MDAVAKLNLGRTLAFGKGRSYGDSCMAESDHVLVTTGMDRILSADWTHGVVLAQAGLTLDELIRVALPHGWFPPVTPGTKFVTLGGAVANDVHGKNHHVMGTFGAHVRRFTLYRSEEGIVECSPVNNSALFGATIGGLGLTGIVISVELQLRPIRSSQIAQRNIKFGNLREFFELSSLHDNSYEYAVAWVDCLSSGESAGRGHYTLGNHSDIGTLAVASSKRKEMPFDPPVSLVNSLSLRAFNSIYYNRQPSADVASVVEYDPFFYPLDKLLHWNRMYGRAGFQQYQCVVPHVDAYLVTSAILSEISKSGAGSFLAVLKRCGDAVSPGLLSFPMPGVSLALDFPQRDNVNERLFAKIDSIVHEASGRLYPAKDAHMSAAHFQRAFPVWERVERWRDPQLMSRFWKRVTLN